MDPLLLRFLHVGGAIALFTAIGAMFLGGSSKKGATILHGISLLVLLLVGFAILKKPPMDEPWWMIKVGIWLFIGAAPALAQRKVLPAPIVLTLCLLGGLAAAWLGIHRGL